MPPFETLISHDIEVGQIEFKSIVFLRDDYLGPIPINKRPVTLVADAWSRLLERVTQPKTPESAVEDSTDKLLTTKELAKALNLSTKKIHKLRKDNAIPCFKYGDRSYRYCLSAVREALPPTPIREHPVPPIDITSDKFEEPLEPYDWDAPHDS